MDSDAPQHASSSPDVLQSVATESDSTMHAHEESDAWHEPGAGRLGRRAPDYTFRAWRHRTTNPVHYVWAKPRLRYPEGHPGGNPHDIHEHWIEQFNDLIMVAFFCNLGHLFVSSGPHKFSNFGACFALFLLEMQSLHFASYVVNVWVVADLVTLAACCTVSVGAVIMALGVGTDSHGPCRGDWLSSEAYVRQFKIGILVSMLGQMTLHIQVVIFEGSRGPRATSVTLLSGCVCILVLLGLPISEGKFTTMCLIHAVTYFVCLKFTDLYRHMNFAHISHRLDSMILVAMGEWVIQIVIGPNTDILGVAEGLVQTSMVLVCAILYFNTRPHEMVLDFSSTMQSFLVALNHLLQYSLAFTTFLVAVYIDLVIAIDAHPLDYGCKEPKKLDDRRLGGGGAHSSNVTCELGLNTWSLYHARMIRAWALTVMRVILLYLRTSRKNVAIGERRIGKKFIVRIVLCFTHVFVPIIVKLATGAPCVAELPRLVSNRVHFALLAVDLCMELSIYHLSIDSEGSQKLQQPSLEQDEVELTTSQATMEGSASHVTGGVGD